MFFEAHEDGHVFVASAAEVDEDGGSGLLSGDFLCGGEGVGGFDGGEDAFEFAEGVEGFDGFVVGDGLVFDAADFFEEGVFGADAWVVESGGDGVGVGDLAVVGLEEE